jgi:PRP38 family
MYVRLAFKPIEVYEVLEPMLNDYRKLRYRHQSELSFTCPQLSSADIPPFTFQVARTQSCIWMNSSTNS